MRYAKKAAKILPENSASILKINYYAIYHNIWTIEHLITSHSLNVNLFVSLQYRKRDYINFVCGDNPKYASN